MEERFVSEKYEFSNFLARMKFKYVKAFKNKNYEGQKCIHLYRTVLRVFTVHVEIMLSLIGD